MRSHRPQFRMGGGMGLGNPRGGAHGTAAPFLDVVAMAPFYYYDVWSASSLFQSGTRASPGPGATGNNDPVGLVLDLSGNNIDLTASGTARPLLKISGGLRWIECDGVNDALIGTHADPSAQWNCVSGFRVIGAGAGNQIHGHSNGNITLYATGTGYGMFANPSTGPAVVVSNGTDAVITEKWAGTGDTLQLDKNAAVTTPSITNVFGGNVGIGGDNLGAQNTNIRWVGTAKKHTTLFTALQLGQLQTYFAALQGRTI